MENLQAMIPNFDALYEAVLCFVEEHQGEKGYICTNWRKDNLDIIYSLKYYFDSYGTIDEDVVYGVRVRDKDLQILPMANMETYINEPSEEDYSDEELWYSLKYSDVYYIPTLINIAECIEEYVI